MKVFFKNHVKDIVYITILIIMFILILVLFFTKREGLPKVGTEAYRYNCLGSGGTIYGESIDSYEDYQFALEHGGANRTYIKRILIRLGDDDIVYITHQTWDGRETTIEKYRYEIVSIDWL